MSENGEIYTAGKIFTLLQAMTAVTNLTSAWWEHKNHKLQHTISSQQVVQIAIYYYISIAHPQNAEVQNTEDQNEEYQRSWHSDKHKLISRELDIAV